MKRSLTRRIALCRGFWLKSTLSVCLTAPAKPNRPTVEGTDVDKVRVTYNFGLGGGYTHEFLVMYRKKSRYTGS